MLGPTIQDAHITVTHICVVCHSNSSSNYNKYDTHGNFNAYKKI